MTLYFESPAEMQAYPIIHTLSIKHKLQFYYQYRIYDSNEYPCKKHKGEWGEDYGGFNPACKYCKSHSYEKYRIDFVLKDIECNKLGIEIDGKEYHQDLLREEERDIFLYNCGFVILHIPANKLNSSFLKTKILEYFNIKED